MKDKQISLLYCVEEKILKSFISNNSYASRKKVESIKVLKEFYFACKVSYRRIDINLVPFDFSGYLSEH